MEHFLACQLNVLKRDMRDALSQIEQYYVVQNIFPVHKYIFFGSILKGLLRSRQLFLSLISIALRALRSMYTIISVHCCIHHSIVNKGNNLYIQNELYRLYSNWKELGNWKMELSRISEKNWIVERMCFCRKYNLEIIWNVWAMNLSAIWLRKDFHSFYRNSDWSGNLCPLYTESQFTWKIVASSKPCWVE